MVGLRSDGSVVAMGYNNSGQCNVTTGWELIVGFISGSITDLSTGQDIAVAMIFTLSQTAVSVAISEIIPSAPASVISLTARQDISRS